MRRRYLHLAHTCPRRSCRGVQVSNLSVKVEIASPLRGSQQHWRLHETNP